MSAIVLCLNAGSSSLKFALFDADAAQHASGLPAAMLRGEIDAPGGGPPVLAYVRAGQARQTLKPEAARGDIGAEVAWLIGWLERECGAPRPGAVAHRVVHGGQRYTRATRISADVFADLQALTSLAPLHQGPGLAGVQAARALGKSRGGEPDSNATQEC